MNDAGHTMDVRDLSFEAETFDVAIDKGSSFLRSISVYTYDHYPNRHYGRDVDVQRRRLGVYLVLPLAERRQPTIALNRIPLRTWSMTA